MIRCEPAQHGAGSPSVPLFGTIFAIHVAVMAMAAAGLLAASGLLTPAAALSVSLILLIRMTSLPALVLLIRLAGTLSLVASLSRAVRILIAVGHIEHSWNVNGSTIR
jgi:hypothetical protein